MNTELSRISGLVDSNGTTHLADYTYLGRNRTAQVDFPSIDPTSSTPGVKFTWLWQTGDTTTPPADPYTGWDRFGRAVDLRWIKLSSGVELERLKHGYDEASNRLYRKNVVADALSKKEDELYGYDGLYQLKEFQRGTLNGGNNGISGTIAAEEDFTFDPTGNWNSYVTQINGNPALNQTRLHNKANGLKEIDSATTYVAEDLAGNMTKVPKPGSWSAAFDLKYDAWNRLVKVADGETVVAEYHYDGLHRRTKKVTGSTTRHYYYSDRWQILEERVNTSTSADRQFVWGLRYIDDLILRDREMGETDERLYVIQDYFQPTAVMNMSGTVLERYGYDAFGTSRVMDANFVTQTASSYEWETRYGAYRWDGETGLYQVRFRYLHPGLGRWVTRDPIGYEEGSNLYQYVTNSPANNVDPTGLQSEFCLELTRLLIELLQGGGNDERIVALNRMLNELCKDPPNTPCPGRPIDSDRGTRFNPEWNLRPFNPQLQFTYSSSYYSSINSVPGYYGSPKVDPALLALFTAVVVFVIIIAVVQPAK